MAKHEHLWSIEELGRQHDRSSFSCGHASLDTFVKSFASQNQKSGISKTFVAARANDPRVYGYYSLAAGSIRFVDLPDDLRKRLPRYPVPVAHLGRLAVDVSVSGRGLGSFLLMDAIARILGAAESIGVHAIEVVAIDDAAKSFYLHYGFTELLDDPHHLYMPLKMLRKLRLDG